MTAKHTPGPWTLRRMEQNWQQLKGATPGLIADIHKDEDAALIASAPELLAALQAIVDEAGRQFGLDDGPGCINRIAYIARQAIAKAGGAA